VKYGSAGDSSRGMKLDDGGLHKSTECLASLSPDSILAPGSRDRSTSQPNLLALGLDDPVVLSSLSAKRRGKSPNRRRVAKLSDGGIPTSKDAGSGGDTGGKSPSRRRAAKSSADGPAEVGKEDGRSRNEDAAATDKLAVIDHTLAKVMSSLKTLDAMEQSTSAQENIKNSADESSQKTATAVSETVPIIVKTSSTREDHPDEASSLGSFSRGSQRKAATLPKAGSEEKIPTDAADSQMKHSESSSFNATSVEGRYQSSLSRSDSAPHGREPESATFPSSSVGQSWFEATSRAIPAATPVVPSSAPSGAPAVPPKPSTARKPTVFGSPKTSRPAADGKTGVVGGKPVKK